MSYFCDVDNREEKEIAPGISMRTFWGNNMLIAMVNLDANTPLPNHSHPHEQAGTVISGMMELTIAGETRKLYAGDSYLIPGGVEHSARTGSDPTVVMDVFSPVREEYKY